MPATSAGGPSLPPWVSSALNWLGYALGYAAGLFALVYGIAFATVPARPIMWGIAIIACVTLALVSGATASPDGKLSRKEIRVGGKFSRVPMRAWLVVFAILLACGIADLILF